MKCEFLDLGNDRFMIVGSNNVIVSKEEKLKIEKNELILKDFNSNSCQKETHKKIKEIDKELDNEQSKDSSIKKTK